MFYLVSRCTQGAHMAEEAMDTACFPGTEGGLAAARAYFDHAKSGFDAEEDGSIVVYLEAIGPGVEPDGRLSQDILEEFHADDLGEDGDGDMLHDICLAACEEWEIAEGWLPFIADLVNGTNGAYGSAGMFDPNVATEYAGQLAAAIGYRLADNEDEASIRRLDFITLYNTEMIP